MAHRYWKVGDFNGGALYQSMAECYLRATMGGSNEIPVAGDASSYYNSGSNPVSNLWDGDPSTWWADNGSEAHSSVYFDYGTAIDVVELAVTARNGGSENQTPTGGNIMWSDTGLTGPWTWQNAFEFTGWTGGETQVAEVPALPDGVLVYAQSAYVIVGPPIVPRRRSGLLIG